jgi:adenine deaminase
LNENEALAMVTINPAKQLGIDDKVGSIEVGKSADLVLFDKHPLSGFSKAQKVWIDGHEYFDREKDIETRPEFEKKKKALQDKEAAATPPQGRRRNGAGGVESTATPNQEESK